MYQDDKKSRRPRNRKFFLYVCYKKKSHKEKETLIVSFVEGPIQLEVNTEATWKELTCLVFNF